MVVMSCHFLHVPKLLDDKSQQKYLIFDQLINYPFIFIVRRKSVLIETELSCLKAFSTKHGVFLKSQLPGINQISELLP